MTPCSECRGVGQIILFQYPRMCPTCRGIGGFEEPAKKEAPPKVSTPLAGGIVTITGGTGGAGGPVFTITGGTGGAGGAGGPVFSTTSVVTGAFTLTSSSPSPNVE